jgi:hypothetical protein
VVKGRIWGSVTRFRSVEVLLRVLAFHDRLDDYEGNLADFLNHYMHDHAEEPAQSVEEKIAMLAAAANVTRAVLDEQPQGKLSLAIIEAILVAAVVHRGALIGEQHQTLHARYEAMLAMPAFAEGARYAVSSVENVKNRLGEAMAAFGG